MGNQAARGNPHPGVQRAAQSRTHRTAQVGSHNLGSPHRDVVRAPPAVRRDFPTDFPDLASSLGTPRHGPTLAAGIKRAAATLVSVDLSGDPELGTIRGLRGGVATRRVPRTDFSLADIQQLAAALGDCAQLKKLTWGYNKFDKAAAAALAPGLAKLSQLQSLDLTCTELTAEVLAALAPAISKLGALKTMCLEQNKLGTAGATVLGSAVAKLTQIQSLGLRFTDLDHEGGTTIAHIVKNCNALTSFSVIDNTFTDATHAEFIKAALEGPAYQWLSGAHGLSFSSAVLELAALPPELANDVVAVTSYVAQQHRGQSSTCRGTLIIIGYQGAGKTSLVWRLRNPTQEMPITPSTDGIAFGTVRCCERHDARLLVCADVAPHDVHHPAPQTDSWILQPPTSTSASTSPTSITLRTIDLGGQETYFATHPFFFSRRAVYLLCWSGRDMPADDSGSQKDPAHPHHMAHFLRTVTAMAPESPIVVSATKCDESAGDTSANRLRSTIADLRSTFPRLPATAVATSAKAATGFEGLASELWSAVSSLPHAQRPLPASYEALIHKLETEAASRDPPLAHLTSVVAWAAECGLTSAADATTAIDLLHDLGMITLGSRQNLAARVHDGTASTIGSVGASATAATAGGAGAGAGAGGPAPPSPPPVQSWHIADTVVLKPEWLAKAMSTVVTVATSKTTIIAGRLYCSDLDHIWGKEYPAAVRPILLDLLQACEVTYSPRDKDGHSMGYTVVPAMLREVPQPAPVEELFGDVTDPSGANGDSDVKDQVDASDPSDATDTHDAVGSDVCVHVELSHAPHALMPRLMARIGSLACNVWHLGGLYRDAAGTTQAVLNLKDKTLEMTARGVVPFGLLYKFYSALVNLLPDVSTTLKVETVAVACPSCKAPKLPLQYALHTPAITCYSCPARPSCDLSGLAVWGSDDDSLAGALAAAHREVLRHSPEANAMVGIAHTKLVSWTHDRVMPLTTQPPLWTWLAADNRLHPLCQHPAAPHVVQLTGAPEMLSAITKDEKAYLKHTHAMATLGHPEYSQMALPDGTTYTTTNTLQHVIRTFWECAKAPPLESLPHPDDSSARIWLCREHAAALRPPPDDTGNILRDAPRAAQVNAGLQRWLRVGVALKCTSEQLAALLQERVQQWYCDSLALAAASQLDEEHAHGLLQTAKKRQSDGTQAALQHLIEASAHVALVAVAPDSTLPVKHMPAELCTHGWDSRVISLGQVPGVDPAAAIAMMVQWQKVSPPNRRAVFMKPLHVAVRRSLPRAAGTLPAVLSAATAAFVQELKRAAAAAGSETCMLDAVAVKDAVLLLLAPPKVPVSPPPVPGAAVLHCTAAACAEPPQPQGRCDHTRTSCSSCRTWAKAIRARHRNPKSMKDANWRNCIPQLWSNPDLPVNRRAWEAAKAYMAGGCAGATCAAKTDFAALVNVIDFCVGLYNKASDTQEWQPLGTDDAVRGFVTNILAPVRQARNSFAHNSRLAFDKEQDVQRHIAALLMLLAVLPVPTADAGCVQRKQAVAKLEDMQGLAPAVKHGGAVYTDVRDDLDLKSSKLLGSELASVMHFLLEAGSHDTAELRELLPQEVVEEGCAEVSRRVAVRRSGGAGRGAGAGGEEHDDTEGDLELAVTAQAETAETHNNDARLQQQMAEVRRAVARATRWLDVKEAAVN